MLLVPPGWGEAKATFQPKNVETGKIGPRTLIRLRINTAKALNCPGDEYDKNELRKLDGVLVGQLLELATT
jgi:hypothetical protein